MPQLVLKSSEVNEHSSAASPMYTSLFNDFGYF